MAAGAYILADVSGSQQASLHHQVSHKYISVGLVKAAQIADKSNRGCFGEFPYLDIKMWLMKSPCCVYMPQHHC
jgi:hypothetical protein